MTSNFSITNITVARHPSRQDSSVHFESGVNAICGPSNSGESCSLQCINYMFAMDHTQFVINKEPGHTRVRMGVRTLRGALTLVRPIGKGNNTEITSPNPHIYSGIYMRDKPRRPPTLNSARLRLIGYEHTEELRIISNKDLAVNAFTWRAFWHALHANEDRINTKGSVPLPQQKTAESAFKCALASLITGKDCAAYTRDESTENKKFRNNAIIDYLALPPEQLDQRIELIDRVSGTGAPAEIEQQVEEPSTELGHAQQGITEAAQRGQEIVSRLHEVRGNLAESRSLRGRYEELASSYRALIDRFDFVHEGHILTGDLMSPTPRLACTQNLPSEAQASVPVTIPRERKELPIVRLEGLGKTMSQTDREQGPMQGQKHELVSEAETSAFHIRGELKPQLQALTISIAGHNTIIAMQTERQQHLEHKKVTEEELKDLINHVFTVISFNLLNEYPEDFWSHVSTNLVDILYACAFLELKDPRFSHELFDTVVNGKTKTKEGQAYRPFVNTAVLLALRNYLSSEAAVQNSGVLIINTPPLGLDNPQTGPDLQEARGTIPAALYDYFAGAQDVEQVIIADNTKFMPDIRPLHER